MKILVSNDDGILANGIRALIEALSPSHEVYVVAPDRERSAAGHSLTLQTPLRVEEVDAKYGAKRCWMTTGTPGDCVKLAINAILSKDELPDLVISGINHGPNLGADILYSGTVSCAMEGAMMGYPSIATSLASMSTEYEAFKVSAEFVADLLNKIDIKKFPSKTILNINIKSYGDNISQFVLNNYSLFGELFRKRFTKKAVLKDVKNIIDDLNKEMQEIFSNTQSKEPLYLGTAIICKEWFDSSEERKKYQGIQKKLKPINNI